MWNSTLADDRHLLDPRLLRVEPVNLKLENDPLPVYGMGRFFRSIGMRLWPWWSTKSVLMSGYYKWPYKFKALTNEEEGRPYEFKALTNEEEEWLTSPTEWT